MQARAVAIVTGGAGLIGAAVAERLEHDGAAVAVLDTKLHRSKKHLSIVCDVSRRPAVQEAVAAVTVDLGPPTVLINCAGIVRTSPFLELSDELWDEVLRVNLTGTFIATQEVARRMPDGVGRIINLSSVAGRIANRGQAAYAASKAAVLALTRASAVELAPRRITVNAVAPGPVEPRPGSSQLSARARHERLRRIPVHRFCTPEEVASAVSYLASPEAAYVTGSVIWLDGGLTIAGIQT